ncbi:hypothetical protein HAX54_050426 [Datura stramonium]|uniref:DUF599 domain-containing protein n=1 Tax=Datura stramonium TaxID=4076 RepID=A0ABS8SX44_DATST|nr:hypothetical protein [Datura stramonium]
MEKEILDYVLVPLGLLFMVSYHVWLLHRILKYPTHTVIGINSINRRLWVLARMEDSSKNGVLAVQTLRNNIMASTLLATTAIMLSSLVTVLMTGGSKGRLNGFHVYGDKSELCLSIKFFTILVCFMVAFLFNVQSIRYYSHATILINVPYKKLDSSRHCMTPAEYVGMTVNRGSYFWSLGLRAFYFSFPLFLWIFGPIPMFLCCIFLVVMLYFLDVSSDFGWVAPTVENKQQTV